MHIEAVLYSYNFQFNKDLNLLLSLYYDPTEVLFSHGNIYILIDNKCSWLFASKSLLTI